MDRWGPWSLALTPLPVVGDPITVVAGLARVSFGLFVAVVIPLRVGRYVLIAGLL
jgi:membrane protein YqaA with SNARE-associated domain